MRHDVRDQLSVQQTLAGAGAQVSTNSKQKPAAQDLGIGKADMGILFAIDSGDLAGAGTDLTLEIIQADDAALTSNVEQISAMTVAKAELVDGSQFFLSIPGNRMDKAYFGARYTPVGGAITGDINAYYGSKDDFAPYKSFTSTYVVKNN